MARELAPGQKAPDFTLPDQDGTPVSLKSLRGQPVVLYFYPKDDTPGCTKEACDFRDAQPRLTKGKAVVLGVSLDSGESHRKFIAKFSLPFRLLSDEDAKVSKAYGVYKQKSMYGKTYWGIERSTFVIDEDGAIKTIFRKVKVDGHVDEVQAALKAGAA
jgi:thioredoxin-dependent peroxiredoxin